MTNDPADLIAAARDAATRAHAIYSRFHVGAALRLTDGSIVSAANFENASYGLSLCAETVAVASASATGHLADIVSIAVVGGARGDDNVLCGDVPIRPCGRCRQVLNEAAQIGGRDIAVHCAGIEGDAIASYMLSALLPDAFGPRDLGLGSDA